MWLDGIGGTSNKVHPGRTINVDPHAGIEAEQSTGIISTKAIAGGAAGAILGSDLDTGPDEVGSDDHSIHAIGRDSNGGSVELVEPSISCTRHFD